MKHLKSLVLLLLSAALVIWGWPAAGHSVQPSAVQINTVGSATANELIVSQANGSTSSPFIEADQLYRNGQIDEAVALYRQLKPEFEPAVEIVDPIYEAGSLSPEAQVYWTNAQTAIDDGDEALALETLQQLYAADPEFIPGTLALAEILAEEDQEDEALELLERAATNYPYLPDVIMTRVEALSDADDHLEASIAAREFALVNLDHPQAEDFEEIGDKEYKRFTRSRRRGGIIGGLVNMATRVITGDGPFESLDNALETADIIKMMVGDESALGAQLAEGYKQQLTLVEDEDKEQASVARYVTQLGLEMAQLSGRELEYEFFVVQDTSINAFALPGGKIFVNTGAIKAAHSQAELAGLLAHEVSHSVLSHGVQSFFRDDMISRFAGEANIQATDFLATLVSLHYSRQQEQRADVLGNRILSTSSYAADGLRNFMQTLGQATQSSGPEIEYLSSHPLTEDRVDYLEEIIQRNGYNRYALEGVDRHSEIQAML